jgi:sugar O-acyltransferase (sialic acid O-acetyltransferase NeuD family)
MKQTAMTKSIVICGAGGHGLSTLALLSAQPQFKVVGFLDDTKPVGHVVSGGLSVLGGIRNCEEKIPRSTYLALGIGGPWPLKPRAEIFTMLSEKGFVFPELVHPSAVIDSNVFLAHGVQVHANATIRYGSNIGANVLINTGAIVEHECKVGESSVLSPKSLICGKVTIGARTLVGAGAVVLENLDVGSDVLVGASALVLNNLENFSYFKGVPAKRVQEARD